MKTMSNSQLNKLYVLDHCHYCYSGSHEESVGLKEFEKDDLLENIKKKFEDITSFNKSTAQVSYHYNVIFNDNSLSHYIHIELINMYVKDITFDNKYINDIVENIIKRDLQNIIQPQNAQMIVTIHLINCIFDHCIFDLKLKPKFDYIKEYIIMLGSEVQNSILKNYGISKYSNCKIYESKKGPVFYNCTFENVSVFDLFFIQNGFSKAIDPIFYGKTIFKKCTHFTYKKWAVDFSRSIRVADLYFRKCVGDNSKIKSIDKNSIKFEFIDCPKSVYNSVCPKEGEFDAYKIIKFKSEEFKFLPYYMAIILKLRVPATAKRSSAFSKKCRVSEAIPVEIIPINKKSQRNIEKIMHKFFRDYKGGLFEKGFFESKFVTRNKIMLASYFSCFGEIQYKIGKLIKIDDFDERPYMECSTGIHCFTSIKDAKTYYKEFLN